MRKPEKVRGTSHVLVFVECLSYCWRAFSGGAELAAFFGETLRLFFEGALPTCSGLGVMGDYGGDNENDDGCGDCVEYNNAKRVDRGDVTEGKDS